MIDMYRTLGVSIPCDQYKDYFKSLPYCLVLPPNQFRIIGSVTYHLSHRV